MNEFWPAIHYLVGLLAATAGVMLIGRGRGRWIMFLALVVAVAVYGYDQNRFPRRLWNQFHYYLNTKYFDELGYDQLYNCASAALPNRWGSFYRDLSSYEFVYGFENLPPCDADFSPERWAAFSEDVAWFRYQETSYEEWTGIVMLDKGYNGTPSYTFLSELLANAAPLGSPQFWLITYLDTVLLFLAVALIWYTRGTETAGVLALFLLTFHGTFTHLVADWFQWVWFSLSLAAAAAWYAGRRGLAGMALGTAMAGRIFPVFYLLWPLLHWKKTGRRFWAGLAGAGAAWAVLGSLTSRGLAVWPEYLRAMQVHSAFIAYEPRNLGLRNLANMLLNPWLSHVHLKFFSTGRPGPVDLADYQPGWWIWPWVLAIVLGTLIVVRKREQFSLAAGLPAMFAAVVLSPYYWLSASFAFLDGNPEASRRLLLASIALSSVTIFDHLGGYLLFSLLLLLWLVYYYAWPFAAQTMPAPAFVRQGGDAIDFS